jgi:hypothetical protein
MKEEGEVVRRCIPDRRSEVRVNLTFIVTSSTEPKYSSNISNTRCKNSIISSGCVSPVVVASRKVSDR